MGSALGIVAAPFKIYVAAAGTAAPVRGSDDLVRTASWVQFGDDNYTEDGITLTNDLSYNEEYLLNEYLPVAAFLQQQGISISTTVKSVTLEAYRYCAGADETITEEARTGQLVETQAMDIDRKGVPANFGLIVMGRSPYVGAVDEDGMMIYLPRVYISEGGGFSMMKTASEVPVTFRVLKHASIRPMYKAVSLPHS